MVQVPIVLVPDKGRIKIIYLFIITIVIYHYNYFHFKNNYSFLLNLPLLSKICCQIKKYSGESILIFFIFEGDLFHLFCRKHYSLMVFADL